MPFLRKDGSRDYLKEKLWESDERKKHRSLRNTARRIMGLKVGDPRQVDHKKELVRGGTNHRSNLRVVSASTNLRKEAKRKSG